MLFLVEMQVDVPHDADPELLAQRKEEERQRSQELQREGQWLHLWRVTGRYSNVSLFDVESAEELHEILFSLPMFPFLHIKVRSLCRHPSALKHP